MGLFKPNPNSVDKLFGIIGAILFILVAIYSVFPELLFMLFDGLMYIIKSVLK